MANNPETNGPVLTRSNVRMLIRSLEWLREDVEDTDRTLDYLAGYLDALSQVEDRITDMWKSALIVSHFRDLDGGPEDPEDPEDPAPSSPEDPDPDPDPDGGPAAAELPVTAAALLRIAVILGAADVDDIEQRRAALDALANLDRATRHAS